MPATAPAAPKAPAVIRDTLIPTNCALSADDRRSPKGQPERGS